MYSKNKVIIIKEAVIEEVEKTIEYIAQDSPKNAIKFGEDFMPLIDKISKNPETYPLVKQLPTKHNWYRFAIYKKNWKVVFKNLKSTLLFLGFFHNKQSVEKIKKMAKK